MGELRNLSASAIELLGLLSLHLGSERFNRRRIFFSHHHAWGIFGATSVLEWTSSTIRCRRPIAVFDPTFTLSCADPFQHLVRWTAQCIRRLIVSKLVWIKLRLDAALLQRGFAVIFRNRSIQINSTYGHGFDVGVLHRVAAIYQNLLWRLPHIGFNALDPVHELIAIVAGLSDIDSDNDPGGGVGANLYVVAGRKAAVCLFHHTRFRICLTDSNLIPFRFGPRLLDLFQFLQRLFQSLLLLSAGPLSRLDHALA